MYLFTDLPFISKVAESREEFGNKVISIAQDLGVLPHWLMIVMNNESGLNPAAKNPTSSASGLIQFMEPTAVQLGTTTAQLRAMTGVQQLDFVKKYFTAYGYHKKISSVADTYLAIFFPLALYKPDDYVFPKWASDANPIFDLNKDGTLTKEEFKNYVNNKYAAYIPKEDEEALARKKKVKTAVIITIVVVIVIAVAAWFIYKYKK